MLKGKKILLGVSGSIAAYKSALLIRLLVKEGALVRVVMTRSAIGFITPLTLSTLSKNQVLYDLLDEQGDHWNNHVELALWADLLLVAPASANTLARFAHGLCDNLLAAVYLSARCPVWLAPAMDEDMWKHPSTRENMNRLRSFGHRILPVEMGELASGLRGEGRMAEPETLMQYLREHFAASHRLQGKTVLVNAGPTLEPIDPVRYISNHSSGKMGYALAERFAREGAKVILVSGPVTLQTTHPQIHVKMVQTAREMYAACLKAFPKADIAVLAAAVADYTPASPEKEKIKKKKDILHLELVKTPDILKELGQQKKAGQRLIGFALESREGMEEALEKLKRKKLDAIVLNSLQDAGAGFGADTNKVTILDNKGRAHPFELKPKQEVAADIVNFILEMK